MFPQHVSAKEALYRAELAEARRALWGKINHIHIVKSPQYPLVLAIYCILLLCLTTLCFYCHKDCLHSSVSEYLPSMLMPWIQFPEHLSTIVTNIEA